MDSFDSLSYGYGYGLGDVVLIGNEKRMKLNDESELVHVFLDHRVIVLKSCLAPRSGWIHLLDYLVCLVQEPEHQFQLYLMNDQHEETTDEWYNIEDKDGNYGDAYGAKDTGFKYETNKRVWQEVIVKTSKLNKMECRTGRQGFQNKRYVSKKDRKLPRSGVKLKFEEFLIKKLNCKAEAMKFCVVNLISHLPTSLLPIGVANDMTKALMLLGYFHNLLCRCVVAGGNLREVLVNKRGEQQNANGCSELERVRHECVQILKSLPKRFFVKADEYSMREEIVQSSCLLFCTASSSIKLHSTEVELLVIDEAAQLKSLVFAMLCLLGMSSNCLHWSKARFAKKSVLEEACSRGWHHKVTRSTFSVSSIECIQQ
ncbi:hypothetical protein DM860_004700 [Cuscuta australis]|uniref:DNA2/NAM7 helicase helicase domain-containing protein n=1 Tax=Cuscuta australis TaxID=267555 RepID=A0A328DQ88_9ASTE|nr:hypothetical protein DM860_004700 [Cuscuta australis]